MATVNQKILNALDIYNTQKDAQLSDTYVAQVTGKGLSANDFTNADKTKLDNLSDYSLPDASTSTKGGVKIGSNISVANGTISITAANVTNALGYTPTSETYSTGTTSTAGLTKLYTTTGNATDGTITQAAITTALSGKLGTSDNAASATKLNTARSLQVSLSSTAAKTFDGSANVTNIGVTGTLPVANGGTGATVLSGVTVGKASQLETARNLQVSLSSGSAQSFNGTGNATSIGVTGTLPVANGGTGATVLSGVTVGKASQLETARNLQVSLSSGSAQSFNGSANVTNIGVTGTLPVANGGTGATVLSGVTVGKASQLSTARSLQVSLSSTAAKTFDGSANVTNIGVTGTLPVANGGTGATVLSGVTVGKASQLETARNLQVSLSSATAKSFDGSANVTNIGVTGTLPVANGGTGATVLSGVTVGKASQLETARNLQVSLSSGSAQSFNGTAAATSIGVTGTLPITNGGTGATTAANVRKGFFGTDLSSTGLYLLGITTSWADGGYIAKANVPGWLGYGFGTCSTAAGTAAKTVAVTNFILRAGSKVTVKFTNGNSVASPTLNVNSTGAKAIYYRGLPVAQYYIRRNQILDLVYDGTNWEITSEFGYLPSAGDFINKSYLTIGQPFLTAGKFGSGIRFDGHSALMLNDTFALGGSDFTIDFFFNCDTTQYSNTAALFSAYVSTSNRVLLRFGGDSRTTTVYFDCVFNGNSYAIPAASATNNLRNGAWHHIAWVYQHSTGKHFFFADGTSMGTCTDAITAKNYDIYLGVSHSNYFATLTKAVCIIDDFRISKSARWTAAFTPPTESVTSDSNTALLLKFTF